MSVAAMFMVLFVGEWRRNLFSLLAEVDGFFDGVLVVAVSLHIRLFLGILTQH